MRIIFTFVFLFLYLFGYSGTAWSGDVAGNLTGAEDTGETFVVGKIEFEGLKRTREDFIRGELRIAEGRTITGEDLEEGLQRLRNTNFFVTVEVEMTPAGQGRTDLKIIFREKWTLTPVLRGGSGGGVEFIVVGLYDINLLGRGIEAGLQYEQFAEAGGVNIWWRQPHFLRHIWRTAAELQTGRRNLFYFNKEKNKYVTPLSRSTRLLLSAQRQLPWFDLGVSFEPLERRLEKRLTDPLLSYSDFGRSHEEGVNAKVYLIFNGVDLHDYLWEGHRVELSASNLFSADSQVQPYIQAISLRGTHFWRVAEGHNAGLRAHVQWTNGQSLLSLLRLGSLDAVRGLDDGERIGAVTWHVNAESRWLAYLSENIVLQTVIFSDAGNAGKSLKEWPVPVAASAGAGLRLGFRPVARLRLRADYARALSGLRNPQSWVLGMQHYF
ncbi:MAG: hypothetical protein EBR09_09270 [Proteobacteria bacterium]|nr:hypothetical protein [Pseudomonadota bacterium]